MATEKKCFMDLPKKLRDEVWKKALIPGPGVHFIKPNSDYNGTFLEPAAANAAASALYVHGPGIADISYLSAACEHARLSMVSREGKGRSLFLIGQVPVAYFQFSTTSAASEPSTRNPLQHWICIAGLYNGSSHG